MALQSVERRKETDHNKLTEDVTDRKGPATWLTRRKFLTGATRVAIVAASGVGTLIGFAPSAAYATHDCVGSAWDLPFYCQVTCIGPCDCVGSCCTYNYSFAYGYTCCLCAWPCNCTPQFLRVKACTWHLGQKACCITC